MKIKILLQKVFRSIFGRSDCWEGPSAFARAHPSICSEIVHEMELLQSDVCKINGLRQGNKASCSSWFSLVVSYNS